MSNRGAPLQFRPSSAVGTAPAMVPVSRPDTAPAMSPISPRGPAVNLLGDDGNLPDRVLVYARARPMGVTPFQGSPLPSEPSQGPASMRKNSSMLTPPKPATCNVRMDGNQTVIVRNRGGGEAAFQVDRAFGMEATQADVYDHVAKPVLFECLKGYSGAILAYGQTGSGKTHSLMNGGEKGDLSEAGLFPRLAVDLFTAISADYRNVYNVEVSFCQIYNEQVDDLLKGTQGLRLRQAEDNDWIVEGLSWFQCTTPQFLLQCFQNGRKRLNYAETNMNKHSSRSHAVLQLRMTKMARPRDGPASAEDPENLVTVEQTVGKLTFVDLAGSERLKKSQSEGLRKVEAQNINTSLLMLGNCVQALANRSKHIPYRDSTLTRLLESSLAGHCRTTLLVCIAPEVDHAGETISTLEFGSRAMRVETNPEINFRTVQMRIDDLTKDLGKAFANAILAKKDENIAQLEEQVADTAQRLEAGRREAGALQAEVARLEAENADLRGRLLDALDRVALLEGELKAAKGSLEEERRKAGELRDLSETQKTLLATTKELAASEEKAKKAVEEKLTEEKKARKVAEEAAAGSEAKRVAAESAAAANATEAAALYAKLQVEMDTRLHEAERQRAAVQEAAARAAASATALVSASERLEHAEAQARNLKDAQHKLEEELTAARQDIERKGKEAQDELKQREAQLVEERNRLRGELNQVTAAVAAARAAQEAERSNWVAVKEVLQNALKDAETARAAAQDAFAASQERMSKAAEAQAQKISGLESTVEHTQQELAQLRGDLARVTAEREASSAAGAGSEAARREFENMLLSSGVVLQKTGRNGKRQTRNMRFSVAARRLEWADKVDGTWRGVSTAGATAQLEKGVLTVTTKERPVLINLETPSQLAWGQALFAAVMPALAGRKATGAGADLASTM